MDYNSSPQARERIKHIMRSHARRPRRVRLSETRDEIAAPPPTLGERTELVRAELGMARVRLRC